MKCKHLKSIFVIYSVRYQRDGNRDARITAKRVDNSSNKAGKSPYQPNTKNTSSLQRSGNENVQWSGQAKVGESDYIQKPASSCNGRG